MFFKNQIKKALSLALAIVCALTCTAANSSAVLAQDAASAAQQETTTLTEEQKKQEALKKLEEQKALLEADLKNAESKIASLSAESKETEEYIDALDTKIGILNKQLTLLDEQVAELEADITTLQAGIDENQAQADALQQEVDKAQAVIDDLNKKFAAKYDAYCIRMRAIYISGDYNLLTALLTCKDISGFLTRYEMIKAVSKNDAQLDDIKNYLLSQQNELIYKQNTLTQTQESIASKKIMLAQDRAESDQLFAVLTAKTGMYTEFRNEDSQLTAAAEKQLQDLMNGVISADEVKDITTGNSSDRPNVSYNNTDVYAQSDGVYNMTYPVPGCYTVSAGFPNYSNGRYHGGIDFPCSTGTKVVAAQKGVVAGVQRLDYSYGYYVLIYHGTDANGEKVFTLYAHNSSILVSPGQSVYKGQQIAKSGSTGNSTGPHLHFEIRVGSTRINPKNYLSK